MLPNTTPRINRLQSKSYIRQTVLNGPKTGGLADFLEIGTGLSVDSKDLSVTPLTVSIGLGFDERGFQLDETQVIDSDFSIGSLPDDEAKIYLYAQFDASNNVSYGFSLLEPVYSDDAPSAPATGQYWYPRLHNEVGKIYNGASFDDVKRIYLGECTTAGGSVTEVISEQFQVGLRIPYGVEFFTGEYSNGKPVFEYWNIVASTIASTTTIETIDSGLEPIGIVNWLSDRWNLTGYTREGSNTDTFRFDYFSSTGNIDGVATGTYNIGAGTVYKLRYTKP